MPRTGERQVRRQFELTVNPSARPSPHTDWLDNTVHQFSILGSHEHIEVKACSIVETRPTQWDASLMGAPLEGLVRDHRSWDFLQDHGPVTDDPAIPALAQRLGLPGIRRVGQALETVMHNTSHIISYRKGVTTSTSTVGDALKLGAGVCQDFAHLSLALLRRVGVPCRYVSGYLYKEDEPELETHAWVEAFVPAVGWVGLDPTHACFVSENYVTVAVGRSYADVPPNRGVYRGAGKESIQASVTMQTIEERARLTPFSTGLERLTKHSPARGAHPTARLGIGLEQQKLPPTLMGAIVQQQRQQQQ